MPEANAVAFGKVSEDKRREATDGHDGTWVAHPGIVAVAMEQFDANICQHQTRLIEKREDVNVTAADLLEVPEGTITERRFANELQCWRSVYRFLAQRERSCTDQQLDGRCGDS